MTLSDDVRSGLVRETADRASQTAERVRTAAGHASAAATEAASEVAEQARESAGQAKDWVLSNATPARVSAARRGRRRRQFLLVAVLVAALGAGVAAWRRSRASEPAWESVPTGWPASANGASSAATPDTAKPPIDTAPQPPIDTAPQPPIDTVPEVTPGDPVKKVTSSGDPAPTS